MYANAAVIVTFSAVAKVCARPWLQSRGAVPWETRGSLTTQVPGVTAVRSAGNDNPGLQFLKL